MLIGMLGLDRHLAALVLRRPIAHVYGSVSAVFATGTG